MSKQSQITELYTRVDDLESVVNALLKYRGIQVTRPVLSEYADPTVVKVGLDIPVAEDAVS